MDLDYRPIVLVMGLLLIILGLGMIIPVLIDLYDGSSNWIAFSISSALTIFVGIHGLYYLYFHPYLL